MHVLKFGGTSVGNAAQIRRIVPIIVDRFQQAQPVIVVASAFNGVTDELSTLSNTAAQGKAYRQKLADLEKRHLETVEQLILPVRRSKVMAAVKLLFNELSDILHGIFLVRELTAKTRDVVLSFGERLSATILTAVLSEEGLPAEFTDARRWLITDNRFGDARVLKSKTYRRIQRYFSGKEGVFVATGFIGATAQMETTTLGRGGSDLTAAVIAAALSAPLLEIWTDVNGVMSADPAKVPAAFTLPELSYEEAMEMSHFGARLIYPPSIQPAMEKDIPILIKNSFDPAFPGTKIHSRVGRNGYAIRGISAVCGVALVQVKGSGMIGVTGIAGRLFSALARQEVNIILITQASSEHTICFAVMAGDADRAVRAIEKEFAFELQNHQIDEIEKETGFSILAIVGEQMRQTPGIAARVFTALADNGVNVVAIAQGSSELNISVVVRTADETVALRSIHDRFFGKPGRQNGDS